MTTGHRFVVAALALGLTAAGLRLDASTDRALPAPRLQDVTVANARILEDETLDAATEDVLQADAYLLRHFERAGLPMTVFVAYYGSQRSGHTIHSPLNCLPGTGWSWASRDREVIDAGHGEALTVNRNIAVRNGVSLLVYYWYQSRGRVTPSEYQNKLLLVHDALLLHRSDGALVRVTMPWEGDWPEERAEPAAFVRDLHSALTDHLPE